MKWLNRLLSLFWYRLCLFAYRRMRGRMPYRDLPNGVPGVRDVNSVCTVYSPRKRLPGDWGDCEGDGHYLCEGCALWKRDDERE